MTIIKANMHIKTAEGYVTILPTTTSDQVKLSDGSDLEAKLARLNSYLHIETNSYNNVVSTDGQSEFEFNHPGFSLEDNSTVLVVDGKTLVYGVDYIINTDGETPKVVLLDPSNIKVGDIVEVIVETKPSIPTSGSGGGIASVEKYTVAVEAEGQTVFSFNAPNFDKNTDRTMVYYQNEVLIEGTEYTVGDGPTITLTNGGKLNYLIHIVVFKPATVSAGSGTGGGNVKLNKYTIEASTEGQKVFEFNDSSFSKSTHSTLVFLQSELLVEDHEYTVSETGSSITLTDGAPLGYKVHIITVSGSGGSVSGVDTEKLNQVLSVTDVTSGKLVEFYVDGVSGLDTNDGSSSAPFKTIGKAIEFINNKEQGLTAKVGDVTIHVAPTTTYTEDIILEHISKIQRVYLRSSSEDTKVVLQGDIVIRYLDRLALTNFDIKGTGATRASLSAYFAKDVSIERCVIRGATDTRLGILLYSTSLRSVSNTYIDCGECILTEVSNTLSSADSFESCDYINPGAGSVFEYVSPQTTLPTILNRGINTTLVNNGIIVESGSNENGRYIKYADGTMIAYGKKVVSFETADQTTNGITTEYTFPIEFLHDAEGLTYYPTSHGNISSVSQIFTGVSILTPYSHNQASTHCGLIVESPTIQTVLVGITVIGRWK